MGERYDDVLRVEYAEGADAARMAEGCHYDYRGQVWVDGYDHAHCCSSDEALPLIFCGADRASCFGRVVMGEYARRCSDGEEVKIGTCEDLLYMRWDQLGAVTATEPAHTNVRDHLDVFRVPVPVAGRGRSRGR